MDKEIKNEFGKINKSIEDLAATTAHGFKEADKKIADLAVKTEKSIKNLAVSTAKSIEDLAAITARGFEQVDKRFEQVDKRFEQVDKRFEQVDKRFEKIEGTIGIMQSDVDQLSVRLSGVGHEVAEIHKNLTYRDEFDDLMGRVKYVEIRLGIESGK